MYDLLITNGLIIDGTGSAPYRADVAVSESGEGIYRRDGGIWCRFFLRFCCRFFNRLGLGRMHR